MKIEEIKSSNAEITQLCFCDVGEPFLQRGSSGESLVRCLSPGEKDFFGRLVEGHSYMQIADGMDVSINTVRSYVRSVYKKLRVNSRTQAVVKYLRADRESSLVQPTQG